MLLGAFVFHREHKLNKQRKWVGAQKRVSLLKSDSDVEEANIKEKAREMRLSQENTPMIESRASLAQARGESPKTVRWE